MEHNVRFLIVDDSPDNLKLLKSMMQALGYEVDGASSGREGLSLVKQRLNAKLQPYEIIFTDISMPGMSGHEFVSELKKLPEQFRVIAVTAHAFDYQIKECLDSGCCDVLTKPVFLDGLKAIIDKWFIPQA